MVDIKARAKELGDEFQAFEKTYEIKEKEAELECEISFHHIPREQNKMADMYVNMALDAKQ